MSNERWISPYNHSIPYILFSKHFTEINNVYWSYVPASSTIEKKALEGLNDPLADPRGYFLIPDEDDRRLANTYSEWKDHFRSFGNYTRLNMIMLLSSCFETYLRTIVSLAIESKPGAMLGCPDSIDGVFLLKEKNGYGESQSKEYMFSNVIDDVCKGEWDKRVLCYKKYFGSFPSGVDIRKLDELRIKRNSIGHFFARKKEEYEITYSPEVAPPIQVSASKLKEYFNLINTAVVQIDQHLHVNFIGSYDVLKYFYFHMRKNDLVNENPSILARELRKQMGRLGMQTVGKEYYSNLLDYFALQDEKCLFKYSRKSCVKIINGRLKESNIIMQEDGENRDFSDFHFRLFCKIYNVKTNGDYSEKHDYKNGTIYFYSEKLIDFIMSEIRLNPMSVIDELKKQR